MKIKTKLKAGQTPKNTAIDSSVDDMHGIVILC